MNYARMIMLLVGSTFLIGCQVLPQRPPLPGVHDFGMADIRSTETPSPWTAVSVEAPEWLHDPSIRYRLLYAQPTQVRFYSLDRWAAPPPELLASRLAVHRAANGYELKIELQSFEQVFEQPHKSAVLLRFHAHAVDPISGRLAAERNFRLSRPTRSADAAGAVEGFSLIVEQAAGDLARWVANLPPPISTPLQDG